MNAVMAEALDAYHRLAPDVAHPPAAADDALPLTVTIPVALFAHLVRETRAAHMLRQKNARRQEIMADPVLSDGMKLVAMAVYDRLPPPHEDGTPAEPQTLAAETIARDLGSKCTENGPTKRQTVTKLLGDIASLGVVERVKVMVPKTCTITSDRGRPVEKTIKAPTFQYRAAATLPGARLTREEAADLATRTKADRERKRCHWCGSHRLDVSQYICADCGHTTSAAEAHRMGEETQRQPNGTIIHLPTGDILQPGHPTAPPEEFDTASPETKDRNPVSLPTTYLSDRNPVFGEPPPFSDAALRIIGPPCTSCGQPVGPGPYDLCPRCRIPTYQRTAS